MFTEIIDYDFPSLYTHLHILHNEVNTILEHSTLITTVGMFTRSNAHWTLTARARLAAEIHAVPRAFPTLLEVSSETLCCHPISMNK